MLKAIYSSRADITRLCHPDCNITCLECCFLKDIFKGHACAWGGHDFSVQGRLTKDEIEILERVFQGEFEYGNQE